MVQLLLSEDTREKTIAAFGELNEKVGQILGQMQSDMLERARKRRDEMTYEAKTYDEFKEIRKSLDL